MNERPRSMGSFSGKIAAWATTVKEYFVGFWVRVFVHIAALSFTGVWLGVAVEQDHGDTLSPYGGAALCMYLGLICLAARGMSRSFEWLFPAGCGLAQALCMGLLGLPLHLALFWGGAQAWLQRCLLKKGAMGTEYIPLLLLLPQGVMLVHTHSLTLFQGLSLVVLAAGGGLIGFLPQRLRERARKEAEESSPEGRVRAVIEPLGISLEELWKKQEELPLDIRQNVKNLVTSGVGILTCMDKDPRDLQSGRRFLNRYLPAAHKVADSHLKLVRARDISPEGVKALRHSIDVLSRLETAFAKEHARMQANDVTDFSADLKVLDTLLTMDGHAAKGKNQEP